MSWILFFIVVQVLHFAGTWKLYQKAGRKSWEAAIPVYNAIVLMGIINRPKWWVILLFIPVINLLIFPVIWVEIARSFRKFDTKDTWLAILSLGFYNFYLNYVVFDQLKYNANRSIKPPSKTGEWVSSITFAVVAATLVHTYIMQPFTIPTSSLEKSLLIGDFLFVSKFHYGARVPISPISLPMVHDSIPKTKLRSYVEGIEFPYMRLPGLQKVKRNEIVVFNWPSDSLALMWGDTSDKFTYKPIDKKTNYVKRCVGVPGDSLEIKNGYIYINGERTVLPDRAKPQFNYYVETNAPFTADEIIHGYNVNPSEASVMNQEGTKYFINLDKEHALMMQKDPKVTSIKRSIDPKGVYDPSIFPHDPQYAWSQDNYGPIYIPAKGDKVVLDKKSLPFYKRIISEYEKNNFEIKSNGDIYINGIKTNEYTFKQDYFWMMGDNRQRSLDARYWGYTPFDHVVGKPVFIWMSLDQNESAINKKIRWNRLFTTVGGEGEPKSYFVYFLVAIGLYYVGKEVIKRRKK
ncbi:S26 family signal peptidase [Wenyingzhuangia fucanilytica]|uniref:Signal peptidase I n=1 Tax=Wenyingzhuangia fucanilytica TaxID=1790137 RepID=A0A1B1Y329_9FLAO|nr:signal peptidase I [Wenyingzhuangia fucanilytica]ANW95148.1 S26 family signal peptidase [Wenyingzhuangia fucanilytica]